MSGVIERDPRSARGKRLIFALRALGVAGLAGVAAGGVLLARDQRRRTAMSPDQVRERLRVRYAEAAEPLGEGPDRIGES